jgi:hypothetical protein
MGMTIRGMTGVTLAFVFGSAVGLSGCGAGGVDVQFDAPILEAVGVNLNSKKADEEDLPERAGLVVPPSTATLPPPGEHANAAQQNWPADQDQIKKAEADAKAAERERYCREGNWNGKGGIGEFKGPNCQSPLGKAINQQVGGRPAEDD